MKLKQGVQCSSAKFLIVLPTQFTHFPWTTGRSMMKRMNPGEVITSAGVLTAQLAIYIGHGLYVHEFTVHVINGSNSSYY